MLSLAVWTSLVDLLALVASLWLGLYIVTRNARSRVSWLAGLTLWSLSGYFLDSFLHLNPPGERVLAWWTGWTILFSAPLWFHLCLLLVSRELTWHRYLAWVGYAWAAALVLLELMSGSVFGAWTGEPFAYAAAQQPGRWYSAAVALLSAGPLASVVVLLGSGRRAGSPLRRERSVLVWATALALVGGLYLTLSVWFTFEVPILPGQVALGASLMLLGYGVARHNALVEGRSTRVDLIYALVAILVVIGVYLVVTYISYLVFEMPFAVFTFVLMLVIITHSLYEWGASTLDRLFFRRHARQLRANLRALAQEAESYDAETMMAAIVRALCEALGYAHGWIVVAEPTGLCTVVAYPAGLRAPDHPSLPKVPEEAQAVDEGALAGTGLDAAIIAPLFAGGESLGSIILAQRAGPARWDEPRQLELLETVADRVASAIIVERQRQAYAQQIELAVRAFQERERALRQGLQAALAAGSTTQRPGPSAVELRPGIEDALRHLYDYAYLGELELAELEVVEAYVRENVQVVTNLDRGRALSQMVIDVIGKLRPPGPVPQPLTREWEQYTILYDAYVEGALNREIMAKLYVSESSFNRARRRAVRGIARAVAELERAALQSSP